MTRRIKDLKDKKSGLKFFPKTHVKAVVNDNGDKLTEILEDKVSVSSEISTTGDFVYAQDADGKSVRIPANEIAKIVAAQIKANTQAQSDVTFGASSLQALQTTIGTNLYGATSASSLASVVAGNLPNGANGRYNFNLPASNYVKAHFSNGQILFGWSILQGGNHGFVEIGGYEPGTTARIQANKISGSMPSIFIDGADIYIQCSTSATAYVTFYQFGSINEVSLVNTLPSGATHLPIG